MLPETFQIPVAFTVPVLFISTLLKVSAETFTGVIVPSKMTVELLSVKPAAPTLFVQLPFIFIVLLVPSRVPEEIVTSLFIIVFPERVKLPVPFIIRV